jgi:DNA-binding transcriptional LysR family regulator
MPKTIETLLRSTPKIAVTVREGSMDDLLARLREGAIDMVVGRLDNTGRDRDLMVEDLYDPPMNLVSGTRHRLAKKRDLKWEDAMQSAWILPEFGTPMRGAIENLFSRRRRRPEACLVESSSIQTNIGLLNSSELLWVLSNDIATYFQKLGLIQVLALPATPGPSPFIVAYLRGRALSPAAEKFLDALRMTAKSLNK